VVIDVDRPVVVEVAVEPASGAQWDVEIDSAVVVDVDFAVEVGVAAVGVHDQRVAAVDGLAGPGGGFTGRNAFDLLRGGDAGGGEVAARAGGDDAGAVPDARRRRAVAAGLDEACQAGVGRAVPRSDGVVGGGDQAIV